jgi:hypothetical protein
VALGGPAALREGGYGDENGRASLEGAGDAGRGCGSVGNREVGKDTVEGGFEKKNMGRRGPCG